MSQNCSRPLNCGIIEVRFNNLQLLYIDEALGRVDASGLMRESWYRLGIEHQRERAAMEKMHNLSPSAGDAIAAIESGKAVSYGY